MTHTTDHLSDTERTMLGYALDLAQEQIYSRGGEFTDEDQEAIKSLRQLAATVPVSPPADRAALRDRIRRALCEASGNGFMWGTDMLEPDEYGEVADVVLAVLPEPTNQAAEAEPPLSPDYEHPECGFHWHGRDDMDIPMRDGQPICPRCELRKVEKQLHYTQRRREEVGAESLRRGKTVLVYSEKNRALEREVDEVRRQLGAEILRAGQAESTLDHFRGIVRRLAAHAVGFQDVLDDSDRDPWAKTVGADIAELRRMAAEEQPAETQDATTGDKAAALGMTPREYRAASHRAAEEQIREAVQGLYAEVGFRVLDALAARPVVGEQPDTQEADRIVAYRNPALTKLHCLRCTPHPAGDIWTPVTAGELEDGGICTVCGVDVLIEVKPS